MKTGLVVTAHPGDFVWRAGGEQYVSCVVLRRGSVCSPPARQTKSPGSAVTTRPVFMGELPSFVRQHHRLPASCRQQFHQAAAAAGSSPSSTRFRRSPSSAPFPLGDDDGRHAVADQVGQRARLRHEAVDAEDQREARHRNRADGRQRRRQHDEAAAGDAGRALRRQQQHRQQRRSAASASAACWSPAR